MHSSDQDDELIIISKSQLKREAHALNDKAAELAELSKKQREQLPISNTMKEALNLVDKIPAKTDAFNRHVRHLGKLLRNEDLEKIDQVLDTFKNKHQINDRKMQRLEEIRQQLLQQDNALAESLLDDHPGLERQKLRQLIRLASKEVEKAQTGKQFQALFSYLKEHVKL